MGTGWFKNYKRYNVDTDLLVKEEYINYIFHKFNLFKYYLKFTVDLFEGNRVHFLNITVDNNDNQLYYTLLLHIIILHWRSRNLSNDWEGACFIAKLDAVVYLQNSFTKIFFIGVYGLKYIYIAKHYMADHLSCLLLECGILRW